MLKDDVVSHWKRMRENARGVWEKNKEYPCGSQCAFCRAGTTCFACPIMKVTGQGGCMGTPYNDAKNAWCEYRDSKWDESQREWWELKADAMIAFLEGLPDDA